MYLISKKEILNRYYFMAYISIMVAASGFLRDMSFSAPIGILFSVSAFLVYSFAYMLPGLILVGIANVILKPFRWSQQIKLWLLGGIAAAVFSLTHIFLFADRFIFKMYGFHLNGFVWNIICTKGGIESLGASNGSVAVFTMIVAGLLILQFVLLMAAWKTRNFIMPQWVLKFRKISMVCLVILAVSQALIYGISNFKGYAPVLVASKDFPLYQPVTFKGLCSKLGLKAPRDNNIKISMDDTSELNYPAVPISRSNDYKKYNIVWLVAESLRADMLDQEIMPSTWQFSQQSLNCLNHYSGGNGTRMGLFSMFYGLYGNYWFRFLDEQRPPILFDLLEEDNYQLSLYTSAKFSYPEFDKTIFSSVDSSNMHENADGPGWQRDRNNVSDVLDFIQNRDKDRPFMTFMFFESPHARYYFPQESVIRPDYLDDFNYATVDLASDIGLIKNRYINSCHHLDSQIDRILGSLRENNLLDSTIVIVTGDHGEEFMEKGRWGHNSAFTQEQVRTPMVMWIPGRNHLEVTSMTSHMDISTTLIKLLGVKNPVADFSLGIDLLSDQTRSFVVLSDWDSIGYIGEGFKADFPIKANGLNQYQVHTIEDKKVADVSEFFLKKKDNLVQMLKNLSAFLKVEKLQKT